MPNDGVKVRKGARPSVQGTRAQCGTTVQAGTRVQGYRGTRCRGVQGYTREHVYRTIMIQGSKGVQGNKATSWYKSDTRGDSGCKGTRVQGYTGGWRSALSVPDCVYFVWGWNSETNIHEALTRERLSRKWTLLPLWPIHNHRQIYVYKYIHVYMWRTSLDPLKLFTSIMFGAFWVYWAL